MRRTCRTLLVLLPLFAAGANRLAAQDVDRLGKAVAEVERIDALRAGLAATFAQTGAPADQEAFGKVCKPVGMTMQQGAKANGWIARQLSQKFRNPANAPDREATRVLQQFERDSLLQAVTRRSVVDGAAGTRYFRRIVVQESCLLCHGAKAHRPAFIAQNYAADRAFDFRAGDLRGTYSIFVPDKP